MAKLSLFPLPYYYAVIRTDPEAMVKDLGVDDPETLEEAQRMSRKKYLVYLEWPDELPLPGMRWCRYNVSPIGTTLRPPDELQGITPDMVIPIAPNQGLSPDRHPVHPTPSFPFSNCYHWILNQLTVRVRIDGKGVEHDGAFRLSAAESLALQDGFFPDCERIGAFLYETYGTPSQVDRHADQAYVPDASSSEDDTHDRRLPPPVEPSTLDAAPTHVLSDTYYRLVTQRGLRKSGPLSESDDKPLRRCDTSSEDVLLGSHDAQKQSTVTPVTSRDSGIDLFGWDPDPTTAKIPLVEAWLDIDNHLSEDTIPSPVDLGKEFEEIASLIARGLERFALAQKTPEQIKEEHPVSDAEPPAEPEELGERDDWMEINNALWRELRAEYLNSPSSCDPPFLGKPESQPMKASSISPHSSGIVVPQQQQLSPLIERTNTISPSSCKSERSASPLRSLITRFAEPVARHSLPATVVEPTRKVSGLSGALVSAHSASATESTSSAVRPQSPPRRRRSRASTVYHRLRAKFIYFLHPGGGVAKVH